MKAQKVSQNKKKEVISMFAVSDGLFPISIILYALSFLSYTNPMNYFLIFVIIFILFVSIKTCPHNESC